MYKYEEIDDELFEIFKESAKGYSTSLKLALIDNNLAEIRAVTHTIKGSAGSFGFDNIAEIAKNIQTDIDETKNFSNTDSLNLLKMLDEI